MSRNFEIVMSESIERVRVLYSVHMSRNCEIVMSESSERVRSCEIVMSGSSERVKVLCICQGAVRLSRTFIKELRECQGICQRECQGTSGVTCT